MAAVRHSGREHMSSIEETVQNLADTQAIKQLKYRYAAYCDDNYNPDGLAGLFTEGALWDGGILGRAEGREGIRQFFANAPNLVSFAVHQVSNPIIEVNGDTATGSWYLWQPMVMQGQALWLSARYADKYVKQAGNWLFERVEIEVRMLTPYEHGPAKELIIEVPA